MSIPSPETTRPDSAARLIRNGFLAGLGLAAPLVAVALVIQTVELAFFDVTLGDRITAAARSAGLRADQLLVREHEVAGPGANEHETGRAEPETTIRGRVENIGKYHIGSFQVDVEFFDESRRFVGECSQPVQAQVSPGQFEYFQIACSSVPRHATMTVRVVSVSVF